MTYEDDEAERYREELRRQLADLGENPDDHKDRVDDEVATYRRTVDEVLKAWEES